jgi:hypothetical protein
MSGWYFPSKQGAQAEEVVTKSRKPWALSWALVGGTRL